jgi:branched-chain amino acid transport system permease protein
MKTWRVLRLAPTWTWPALSALIILFLPQLGLPYAATLQVELAAILALVVSGLNLSLGYAGELALGQAAMYAAGAYAAGILSEHGQTDLLLQLAVSGAVALLVGVVTGIPGLRLNSWSLAMTSFFLVLIIPNLLQIFSSQTGGTNGLSGIQAATLFGTTLSSGDLYKVIAVVAIIWFALMRNIVTSRHGVAFQVLKQSPVLATSQGISVFRMKLAAYALGAIPAGLAGALFANLEQYISPDAFNFTLATSVLAASILGGSASVYGAAIGAAIMQWGPNNSTAFQQYSLIFYGAFLIIGGVLLRGGIARLGRDLMRRLDRVAGVGTARAPASGQSAELTPLAGALLAVHGVSKLFGGNQALKDVNLVAEPGKVTAIIGPNGSGKTTLLNMVCGFYRTDQGEITLGADRLDQLPPHRRARAGISRTFQTPNLPAGITVAEAVSSGRYMTSRASLWSAILRTPGYRKVRKGDVTEADRVLELAGLAHLSDTQAAALPLGMRRLLELARALIAKPRVLLLDETASGLDEDEVDRIALLLAQIRDAGATVILVEHNFRLVLELADHIVVLAHGEVIAEGPPAEIERNPRVLSEYLGTSDGAKELTIAEELASVAGDPSLAGDRGEDQ